MLGAKVGTEKKAVEKIQESCFSWSHMLLEVIDYTHSKEIMYVGRS